MLVSVVVSAVVYGEKPFSEDEVIPTLETFLQELAEKPPMEAASFASSLGIETEGGRVRVVVEIDGPFSEEGVIGSASRSELRPPAVSPCAG